MNGDTRLDMRHRRSIDLNSEALLAERLELQPHRAMPPRIDATERCLLQLFLRRYVTWCARRERATTFELVINLLERLGVR